MTTNRMARSSEARLYFETKFRQRFAPLAFRWSEETVLESPSRKYSLWLMDSEGRQTEIAVQYGIMHLLRWMQGAVAGADLAEMLASGGEHETD